MYMLEKIFYGIRGDPKIMLSMFPGILTPLAHVIIWLTPLLPPKNNVIYGQNFPKKYTF